MKLRSIVRAGIGAIILMLAGVGAGLAVSAAPPDSVVVLKTKGVTCGSCAGKIQKALKEKGGVAAVEVDVDNGRVTAAFDSGTVGPEALAQVVTDLGYGSSIVQTVSLEEYSAMAGKGSAGSGSGGCGGGCCDKNRKAE